LILFRVEQVVADFMSDRESLPDKSVRWVISDGSPIPFDHEHASYIVSESFGLNCEVKPVGTGQAFFAVVEEMILKIDTDFQRAKDTARHALRRTSTSITIGHSAFVSPSFRREIRSALNRKFTYLQIQFRTVFASELVSSINSRMVDVGLTFTPVETAVWSKYLSA
jgi:hypothetical protein